jgi:CBS-domain-containing membrane protein
VSSTVRDVMSTHVIAAHASATYKELAAMLHYQRVSAFPVVDQDNKVIGIVSETDLLAKAALEGTVPETLQSLPQQRERSRVSGLTAAELMTSPAVTIGPDAPVHHAARLMYNKRVKRLPVVGDDGVLVGIVSRSDVLSVYSKPDEAIRDEVTSELARGHYLPDPGMFRVTVKDGIVTIAGKPENTEDGLDMVAAVRHMEGVVAVRDRLSYPPGE